MLLRLLLFRDFVSLLRFLAFLRRLWNVLAVLVVFLRIQGGESRDRLAKSDTGASTDMLDPRPSQFEPLSKRLRTLLLVYGRRRQHGTLNFLPHFDPIVFPPLLVGRYAHRRVDCNRNIEVIRANPSESDTSREKASPRETRANMGALTLVYLRVQKTSGTLLITRLLSHFEVFPARGGLEKIPLGAVLRGPAELGRAQLLTVLVLTERQGDAQRIPHYRR